MPQLEDGYTQIANELLEKIIHFPFTKREYKIVFAVIRKTYGFHKKTDDMTMTQLAKITGINNAHVGRTVKELSEKNVLLIQQGRYGQVIGLSKNYKNWKRNINGCQNSKGLPKQQLGVAKTASQGCQNSKSGLPKQQPQKILSKNTLQKKLPKNTPKGVTNPTWTAYATAYKNRYKAQPVRNATVNGQLSSFIKRVGKEEAPHIAAYYLTHNNRFYVQKMHPVGLLLNDAEKLRTEWVTNSQVTETKSRQIDKTQNNVSVWEKLANE